MFQTYNRILYLTNLSFQVAPSWVAPTQVAPSQVAPTQASSSRTASSSKPAPSPAAASMPAPTLSPDALPFAALTLAGPSAPTPAPVCDSATAAAQLSSAATSSLPEKKGMQHSKWAPKPGELKWREGLEREEAEARAREAGCVGVAGMQSMLIRFFKRNAQHLHKVVLKDVKAIYQS